MTIRTRFFGWSMMALVFAASGVMAHPGSGIVVDAQGRVFFIDTGQGVWRIDGADKATLVHKVAYHWIALDSQGAFAGDAKLGEVRGGSLERVTGAGVPPALLISSDYPIAVGGDGGLYFVPFRKEDPREVVRLGSDGGLRVVAGLPASSSAAARMGWVNGIAFERDGRALVVSDEDAIRRVDGEGRVSLVRGSIQLSACGEPLAGVPQLPHLRGLAVAEDGTIYAAATGCRTVIAVPRSGAIRTVLRAEAPWAPTGVAVFGRDLYVLEYLHTEGDDRRAWIPRVRKVDAGGRVTLLVTIRR